MSFVSNIVGFTRKSQFAKLGRSDTYNMFVEQKDANEQGFSVVLLPMPGYSAVDAHWKYPGAFPQGTYRCSRGWNGKPCVYGVWAGKLYLLKEDGAEKELFFIADLAGTGKVTWCETTGYGHVSPRLVLCDGVNVYAVRTEIDPQQQRVDFRTVQMPLQYPDATTERITPSWVAFMYGYLVVGAKGTDMFYRSRIYPFETSDDVMDLDETNGYGRWTFSEWQPDNTLIGCSNGSRLFTFGERSFQVFSFTDSTTNPFVSPDTAAQNIGIKNPDTMAMYGDVVMWLGSSTMGDGSVYMMDRSVTPTRISTDEIERMIAKYDWRSAYAFSYRWFSHPLYVLTFPTDGITLAYDLREKGWVRMGSRGANGNETCFRYCYPVVDTEGNVLLQGEGCLVKATEDTWFEHDGTPILRKRAGGIISSDNRPFKVGSVKLITNNGDYHNVLDHAPVVTLRYSRNGTTWVASSTRSLGAAGRYDYDTVFRNLGKAQYFAVEVGSSENIGFALYGLDVSGVTCAK